MEYDEAVEYFHHRFERHDSSIDSVTVRLRTLLKNPLFRALLCARENTMDLATLWDEQKVIIAHLDQVLLNNGGAEVIACLLATQTFLTAMRVGSERTRPVVLSMDELGTQEKFMGDRIAEIVAFSRSQGLRILAAVQYFDKVSPSLLNAMRNSAHFKAYFQMGADDAKKVAYELSVTSGRRPTLAGAEVTVRTDAELAEYIFQITGGGRQPLRGRPAPNPVMPSVRLLDIPVPAMPQFVAPIAPAILHEKPTPPTKPQLPQAPKRKLSAIDTREAIRLKQLAAEVNKYNREKENSVLGSWFGFKPAKPVLLTAEQKQLLKRHDEDEAVQRKFKEHEWSDNRLFEILMTTYNWDLEKYKKRQAAYDEALQIHQEKVRQYQSKIAEQEKIREANVRQAQQEALRQAQHSESVAREQRIKEINEEHASAMQAKAGRWFPYEPEVAAMMAYLWTTYENEEFYVCPYEGGNEVELSRFVRALPSLEKGEKRAWDFANSDEAVAVRMRIPSTSVMVQPIPPMPTEKDDWEEALIDMPHRSAAVRSTASKQDRPFATLIQVADVEDARLEGEPELIRTMQKSFAANNIVAEQSLHTYRWRLEQIKELSAQGAEVLETVAAKGTARSTRQASVKENGLSAPGKEREDDGSF